MADRILGVDFGDTRTGLAVSDALGMLANGIGYVHSTWMPKTAELVAEKAKELGLLVVPGDDFSILSNHNATTVKRYHSRLVKNS